jgi:hypothetical protein
MDPEPFLTFHTQYLDKVFSALPSAKHGELKGDLLDPSYRKKNPVMG